MNIEEFIKPFADQTVLNAYDGKRLKMKKSEMFSLFKDYKSVEWVPYSIVPIKIYDTDVTSAVQVMSREKEFLRMEKFGRKNYSKYFI